MPDLHFRAPLAAIVMLVSAAGAAHAQQCNFEVPFALNSAEVPAGYEALLRQIAETHPDSRISVQGHTDQLGDAAYNRALSERRAQAVAAMLSGNGVPGGNLDVTALGETDAEVASTGASQANRRVEIQIDQCRFANAQQDGTPTTGNGLVSPAQLGLGLLGAAAVAGALASGGTTGSTGGT